MSTISAALGNSGAVLNNQTWNIADNGDDATASTACTRTGGDLTQASPLSVANTTISMPFWFTCTVPTPNGLTALLRTERDRTDPLRLGANETYREAITLAADHVGYPRATIAAVISAEAGLLRGRRLDAATNERFFGKLHPDLDSKAKLDKAETTEWRALRKSLSATWDPRSYNTVSKAAGLTQFLESTWIEVATTPGSYVNQKAKELGLVSIANKVLDRAALLDLRFDATASIVAAAELDKGYFTQLSARTNNDGTPLVPANLTADQKARYIYLVHHEGAGGAVQILKGTLTDARAEDLLKVHVSDAAKRQAMIDAHEGSAAMAYSAYLWQYIDQRITPSNFR
ncbi:MAG: hypothetical protein ACRCVM_15280 [Giesbergeria sp.]